MRKLNFNSLTHNIGIPEGKEDYSVVMNIRNPYIRLVSIFHMHKVSQKNLGYDFETWIRKDHYILMDYQYDVFLMKKILNLKRQPTNYVRMENFAQDILSLKFVRDNMEILQQEIQDNILTNGYEKEYLDKGINKKFWKDYYTSELAEMVQYKMRNEFEFFNYNTNSWK